uniref:histidine kinase n=1 Tax=Cyanothece sp. (strain PCC 7425 / ATCC 29141) TaxID=395961 RepID=B8HRZ6_CYAP4
MQRSFPSVTIPFDGLDPTLLSGLSDLLAEQDCLGLEQTDRGDQYWQVTIAALTGLLAQELTHSPVITVDAIVPLQGVILSGPVPILSEESLVGHLSTWVFTPADLVCQLLPPSSPNLPQDRIRTTTIPLLPNDPLNQEQFCLILTCHWSVVVVRDSLTDQCRYSFDPQIVYQAWQVLHRRLLFSQPAAGTLLDHLLAAFPPREPHYKTLTQFSQRLLSAAISPTPSAVELPPRKRESIPPQRADVELLQALAHEIRTPLTTIKTLIHLLLKRADLSPEVFKRMQAIERECSEQIDRFSLIFKATELETTSPHPATLTPISLSEIFQEGIARWQKQAARYNLELEVLLPPQLPAVVSDPTLLDQVLTGLIEHVTHTLPIGSRLQVQVTLAGEQLKLQLCSQHDGSFDHGSFPSPSVTVTPNPRSPLKSLGQVLMLQPETGNLSLSLPVAKNLFHILGGKLTVRNHPHQGEILTIFLPLGREGNSYPSR